MEHYATLTDLATRWRVDRSTAKAAVEAAGLEPCPIFPNPRYAWPEVLLNLEGWPAEAVGAIELDEQLFTADMLAERFGITSQTVRNYGRAGRLHAVRLTPRAIRYSCSPAFHTDGEAKPGYSEKR